jgi:hypothetical protein
LTRKSAEEIGYKVQQDEKLYEGSLEETKQNVTKMEKSLEKFKYNEVVRLGRILEKTGLVTKNHISGKLKKDLKGYIHRSTVYEACINLDWKDMTYNYNPTGRNKYSHQLDEYEELTKWEQELLETGNLDIERDTHTDFLLEYLTGKTRKQQGEIRNNTPKGNDWRTTLIDEGKDHMRHLIKKMTDARMKLVLLDFRTIERCMSVFGDLVYEEQLIREKQKKILTK